MPGFLAPVLPLGGGGWGQGVRGEFFRLLEQRAPNLSPRPRGPLGPCGWSLPIQAEWWALAPFLLIQGLIHRCSVLRHLVCSTHISQVRTLRVPEKARDAPKATQLRHVTAGTEPLPVDSKTALLALGCSPQALGVRGTD